VGGKFFKDKPLVIPTLYMSLMFSVFVGIFAIIESTVEGLIKGKGWTGWLVEVRNEGKYEFLARCLMMFVIFIPYFAFKELGGLLGEGKLGKLFFKSREERAG